jgi:DNA-binding transcriptional LysR family regulator
LSGDSDRQDGEPKSTQPPEAADEPRLSTYEDLRRTPPWLADIPEELRAIRLDQLATLVSLYTTRSPARTAADLQREQTSVTKQLDVLNRHFLDLCGEPLAQREPHKDLYFYPTGEKFAELSASLLRAWSTAISERRREVGSSITVGVTAFVLDVVGDAWVAVLRALEERGTSVSTVQIHTAEVLTALRTNMVDITLGGILMEPTAPDLKAPDIEFVAWDSEPFVLMTNCPEDQVADPVTPKALRKLKLIAPESGIVADFLRKWYGPKYREELNLTGARGDVLFNLSLLNSGTFQGGTLVPEYLKTAARQQVSRLRALHLSAPDLPNLHVVAGLFVRKADRTDARSNHPINVVWRYFEQQARQNFQPTASSTP